MKNYIEEARKKADRMMEEARQQQRIVNAIPSGLHDVAPVKLVLSHSLWGDDGGVTFEVKALEQVNTLMYILKPVRLAKVNDRGCTSFRPIETLPEKLEDCSFEIAPFTADIKRTVRYNTKAEISWWTKAMGDMLLRVDAAFENPKWAEIKYSFRMINCMTAVSDVRLSCSLRGHERVKFATSRECVNPFTLWWGIPSLEFEEVMPL
jgi:hypothetical protein